MGRCRVIIGVVLVNAFIGFIQEAKAVKSIEALARTMTTEATVLRAGEKTAHLLGGRGPGRHRFSTIGR